MDPSLFLVTLFITTVICAPAKNIPCASDDKKCITELTREMFKAIVLGNKELGIPTADPLAHKRIDGNFDTLKYTLTDVVFTGYSHCEIESASLTENKYATVDMNCPKLKMKGQYTLSGSFLDTPVKGSGDIEVETRDYHLTVNSELKRTTGKDGKTYVSFKNFKIDPDLRGGFDIELGNLFDGNKELAESTKKLIKENWQIAAKLVQGPIVQSNVEKLLKSFNKYLKSKPAEEFIKP